MARTMIDRTRGIFDILGHMINSQMETAEKMARLEKELNIARIKSRVNRGVRKPHLFKNQMLSLMKSMS